jgi:hypothetical protein
VAGDGMEAAGAWVVEDACHGRIPRTNSIGYGSIV